jgi:hypothetical protein
MVLGSSLFWGYVLFSYRPSLCSSFIVST